MINNKGAGSQIVLRKRKLWENERIEQEKRSPRMVDLNQGPLDPWACALPLSCNHCSFFNLHYSLEKGHFMIVWEQI